MGADKTHDETGDDCIIPQAIPTDELGLYSVERDQDAEKDIADYVQGQVSDENVTHVEKIKTEFVLGDAFDIWDVTTNKNRWWVITNPTNLYLQTSFQSLDYTLSFHIGLMRRVLARQDRLSEAEPSPFDEVSRRQDQAHDLLERAVEAEEYQAVGMQLRECLISLVTAMRRRVEIPEDIQLPKAADFVAWTDLLMNQLCPGQGNKELRQYLKQIGKQTWQLVNWLTHARNANQTASSIALQGCDTVLGHFIQILVREEIDNTEFCPQCSSRNVRSHYDIGIEPDGAYYSTCGECRWSNHPTETNASSE